MGTEPKAAGEADPADAGNRIEGHLGRRRQYFTTSHEQEKTDEERILEIQVFVSSLLKEIVLPAVDRLAAIDKAREHLALRYPHFRLIGISAAAGPASDWPAWAIQREGVARG